MMDSSAAKAMALRRGYGKVRHISLKFLWIQARIYNGDLKAENVDTTRNLADLCTKHLEPSVAEKHLKWMGYVFRAGRTSAAPKVIKGEV